MTTLLSFFDSRDVADLRQYLERAHRLDKDGLVRLRGFGNVLAVYVSPIYSGNLLSTGPTVLGLRTVALAKPVEIDTVAPLADLLETMGTESETVRVPDARARAAWTGVTPPREGWQRVGELPEATITEWAKAGIAEVAQTLPGSVGSAIAAKVRLEIWGRAVDPELGIPAGCAFAAAGLGFLTRDEVVGVYQTNGWVRLSSRFGHVLSKQSHRLT
jgi:hypothetical protein